MPTFVSELEPAAVWSWFDELLTIPRASKAEDAARAWVMDVASERGLETATDAAGNLVVRKPAAAGLESSPVVVLQSHLDMVQEKNADVDHDFAHDAIRPRRDGEWLKAEGTTLGADNGLGVAAMLALLADTSLRHGPLELLFTVDEETGLTGAQGLSSELLEGRLLFNLDSEEEGVLTIGCAGGGDSELRLPLEAGQAAGDAASLAVSVRGLKGGHSGVDIHLQRGNAIRILARALLAATDVVPGIRLAAIEGGNARNAIPREASAVLWLPAGSDVDACRRALDRAFEVAAVEHGRSDPDLRGTVTDAPPGGTAFDAASTRRALDLLNALPHGVQAMSLDLPGLVETSVNLAVVGADETGLDVLLNSRSSVAGSLDALRRRIRSIGDLAGAGVHEGGAYPPWKPDVDSRALEIVRAAYEDVHGGEPEVGSMHAGLECGIIGEKYEGMDMVSFGPQIEFPHSPDERVRIESVGPFYAVLRRALERAAGG